MIIKTIKLSSKGQIALPKDLKKRAGLSNGDTLLIIEKNGRILIEKAGALEELFRSELEQWDKTSDEALSNFERNL